MRRPVPSVRSGLHRRPFRSIRWPGAVLVICVVLILAVHGNSWRSQIRGASERAASDQGAAVSVGGQLHAWPTPAGAGQAVPREIALHDSEKPRVRDAGAQGRQSGESNAPGFGVSLTGVEVEPAPRSSALSPPAPMPRGPRLPLAPQEAESKLTEELTRPLQKAEDVLLVPAMKSANSPPANLKIPLSSPPPPSLRDTIWDPLHASAPARIISLPAEDVRAAAARGRRVAVFLPVWRSGPAARKVAAALRALLELQGLDWETHVVELPAAREGGAFRPGAMVNAGFCAVNATRPFDPDDVVAVVRPSLLPESLVPFGAAVARLRRRAAQETQPDRRHLEEAMEAEGATEAKDQTKEAKQSDRPENGEPPFLPLRRTTSAAEEGGFAAALAESLRAAPDAVEPSPPLLSPPPPRRSPPPPQRPPPPRPPPTSTSVYHEAFIHLAPAQSGFGGRLPYADYCGGVWAARADLFLAARGLAEAYVGFEGLEDDTCLRARAAALEPGVAHLSPEQGAWSSLAEPAELRTLALESRALNQRTLLRRWWLPGQGGGGKIAAVATAALVETVADGLGAGGCRSRLRLGLELREEKGRARWWEVQEEARG